MAGLVDDEHPARASLIRTRLPRQAQLVDLPADVATALAPATTATDTTHHDHELPLQY